jgi:hypothetical protein
VTREDFSQAMLDLFADNCGLPRTSVVFKDQRGDRPDMPYATVKILSGPKVLGRDEHRPQDIGIPGDFNIAGLRQYLVEFEILTSGDNLNNPDYDQDMNAHQLLQNFRDSLETITVPELLNSRGVSIHVKNDIQNLTGLLDDTFQNRAILTITFGVASNIADSPSTIEHVGIGGTVVTDVLLKPTITVPQQIITKP